MKLEISVKAYFDDIQGMIDEIKRLQTYKLFEGDDMVLVDLDAVVAIMANHIRADKCSEIPNGWTPCTPETMPKESGKYIVTAYDGNEKKTSYAQYQKRVKDWVLSGRRAYWKVIAWQPLPEPYREGEQDE